MGMKDVLEKEMEGCDTMTRNLIKSPSVFTVM